MLQLLKNTKLIYADIGLQVNNKQKYKVLSTQSRKLLNRLKVPFCTWIRRIKESK